jgi:hypothetical protein
MGRILLLLACVAILALPAAAAAGPQAHGSKPGFLVVRDGSTDGGVTGKPVATVVVHGFVIGHIEQEGAVEIYHFNSGVGAVAQVSGVDVSRERVKYRTQRGTKFSGSDFRFRAVGGFWRVVVYGAGVSLYAGGEGHVSLHGSVFTPRADGRYSLNGGRFTSLPLGVLKADLGTK